MGLLPALDILQNKKNNLMPNPTSPQPAKRSTWRRKLLVILGSLLVLLVVAYFVVTSSDFFKGLILPRASKAIGGQITVADASISPFSSVHLHQLKVQTTGTGTALASRGRARLRYSLFSILSGTIKVSEVTIESPVVQIIQNADGTSNLDPLSKKETQPSASKVSTAPGKPPQVDLEKLCPQERHNPQRKNSQGRRTRNHRTKRRQRYAGSTQERSRPAN